MSEQMKRSHWFGTSALNTFDATICVTPIHQPVSIEIGSDPDTLKIVREVRCDIGRRRRSTAGYKGVQREE